MAGDRELYVYGLAVPGLPSALTVLRRRLRTVPFGGIDAVVEFTAARPQPTIEALQAQHAVATRLSERVNGFLPARFGSLTTESALKALVTTHRPAIADALSRVRDRTQMTIRVFGPRDAAAALPALPPTGTAFLQQRRERAHHLPREVETIREQMRAHVLDERVEPGERSLRVTVFHLVARTSVDAYRQAASVLASTLSPHRVTITGPTPVFAFTPQLF